MTARLHTAAVLATLLVMAAPAHALSWICTTSEQMRVGVAAADLPDGATASGAAIATRGGSKAARGRITKSDLVQAYSGQPVLISYTWLLAVMLPATHPDSRQAFADLGLNPVAAERMANSANLVDRGIRIVQTPDQMIAKIAANPPAVGYSSFFVGARDVASCF
jgi:hypothetical protein